MVAIGGPRALEDGGVISSSAAVHLARESIIGGPEEDSPSGREECRSFVTGEASLAVVYIRDRFQAFVSLGGRDGPWPKASPLSWRKRRSGSLVTRPRTALRCGNRPNW